MKYFISASTAYTLSKNKHVKFLDCRFDLNNPKFGREEYHKSHIPFAQYIDLNENLSGAIEQHGGRHPLPDLNTFCDYLGSIGVSNDSIIICYDSGTHENAARCLMLLKLIGHETMFILNGGIDSWVKNHLPTTSEIIQMDPINYRLRQTESYIVDHQVVRKGFEDDNTELIDSREDIRYRGEYEPIDAIAGHIPTAVNYFWKNTLNDEGLFKNKIELQEHFSPISNDKEIIVYCGSGVTGCVNVLALEEAGYQKVKLYAGSYSDWISYSENAIEKK
ncbi:sulfurtransferase [Bacillus sp. RG28]|uniref:Sulfurtransferase n=1 Tax=Gottfriedia endophytica TaxID=2820819 RepID=A0A940SJE9_9BACI|nr:sulfurtransferase [Gottfriedia endophytica]MBP0724158.1 sulfurtransferase [Gottfriedia endophytica]